MSFQLYDTHTAGAGDIGEIPRAVYGAAGTPNSVRSVHMHEHMRQNCIKLIASMSEL